MKPRALEYFNYNRYVYAHPGVWTFYEEEEPVSGVMVGLSCSRRREPFYFPSGFVDSYAMGEMYALE